MSRNIFIGAVTRVAVFVVVLADEMMLSKTLAVHLNCWDLDASPPHSPRYKKSSLEQKQLKRRATRSSGWPENKRKMKEGKYFHLIWKEFCDSLLIALNLHE